LLTSRIEIIGVAIAVGEAISARARGVSSVLI
jgi:hypothetical protein